MKEVIYRRYFKVLHEKLDKPDLIIVDGGIIQVNAAKEVLEKDPKFELKENKVLKQELFSKYNEQLVNIGT